MLSSLDLEVMNSTNPELNWKTVTKGRSSRKSTAARSLKVGNLMSPKRVGDFSESDSDKACEVVRGESAFAKSGSVPIKKRRHLPESPPPSLEDQEQLLHFSGHKSSNGKLREIDESTKIIFGEGFRKLFMGDQPKPRSNDAGDFSGIELLAAAASMDDAADDDNANKQDVAKDNLMPNNSDLFDSANPSEAGFKSNEPENVSNKAIVHGVNVNCSSVLSNSAAAASQSLGGSSENRTMPAVSRHNWDLNYPMDDWEEPYGYSVTGNTSKDVGNDVKDDYSNLQIEDNKLTAVSPDTICYAAEETSYQGFERDSSERIPIEVSKSDANIHDCNRVAATDTVLNSSPSFSLGVLIQEENFISMRGPVAKTLDEDCSNNVREFDRITSSCRIPTTNQDITALVMPTGEIPQSLINGHCEDNRDAQKDSELRGTFIQDCRLFLTADSETQNDGNIISCSRVTDLQEHLGMAALVTEHEDKSLAIESTRNMTGNLGKSYSPPTAIVGKSDSAIDPPNSDSSQNNHVKMVDGVDPTGFQEGYDSPYEDGELRGSVFYSWKENEIENECIDYESDGRNGDDGSDAADYHGSEIVEGGPEGSHGAVRSSPLAEGKNEGEFTKRHVKDDSDNNEMAGKGSKAGSGTTVESMEIFVDENVDGIKRSRLTDQRDAVDVKLTRIDEYESKISRRNMHSRVEGWSCMNAADGKDGFVIQQCRSRRGGSYFRSERDISPERFMGRYRPPAYGVRDRVHQFTTSCSSRRCYTSNYRGPECRPQTRPRSRNDDSAVDFHDPRPGANYFPEGLRRPFTRRPPVERDDYIGPSRRMPPTRGVGNYRRGGYSQCGRVFQDELEPLPDGMGSPVRMPRYSSRRDRSFSPSSGRNSYRMPLLPRNRSRSKSRTRSPRAWNPNREEREHFFSNNRRDNNKSRSPDLRPAARMERTRVPFRKPAFQSGYGERVYNNCLPQRNPRWVDDRSNFVENHDIRRRRSPLERDFSWNRRFDAVESSGRLKSDEHVKRSRRFSSGNVGGRESNKLETGNEELKREGEAMQQRAPRCDDGGDVRGHRNNGFVSDFEMSDLNNKEDDAPVDVHPSRGNEDDNEGIKN